MQPFHQISLKKRFLYVLIGSVGLSALLGLLALLIGGFSQFEFRVLLTSLTISATSLFGLSCGAALELNRARRLPICGMVLALLAALLTIIGIWTEPNSEFFWKTAATTAIFAAACSHVCLLLLARLAPRFAWSVLAAYVAVFGVAFLIAVMVWGEVDDSSMLRLLGAAAILNGAITLLIPIFHRLSRSDIELSMTEEGVLTLTRIDDEIAQLHQRLDELEHLREQVVTAQATTDVATKA